MRNTRIITIILNGSCNLRCKYCFINKENKEVFTNITKELLDAIDNGTYRKRIMDMMPTIKEREIVEGIDFWGGEPTLHLNYAYKVIEQLIDILPNIRYLHFSSNFSLPDAAERVEEFINKVSALHKERFPYSKPFHMNMQISVDGPSEVNDYNRGESTSNQILSNFMKLALKLPSITSKEHFYFHTHTHGVCDTEKLEWLTNLENIYRFFKYYYQYFNFLKENNIPIHQNSLYDINIVPGENFMFPGKETSQTGKIAAKTMQAFYEFYTKPDSPYFRFEEEFRDMIYAWYPGNGLIARRMRSMFSTGKKMNLPELITARDEILTHNITTRPETTQFCGVGDTTLLVTPDDHTYAICQNVVFDRYPAYVNQFAKINSPNDKFIKNENINYADEVHRWIFSSDDEYARFEKTVKDSKQYIRNNSYYGDELLAQAMIETSAKVGVIDPKYKDPKEYKFAAKYALLDIHCISSFLQISGSIFVPPGYFIPLILNGAMDYIEKLTVLALEKEIEKCKK